MVSILCIAQWKFIEHFALMCEFYSESETSTMADGTNYTGDERNNVDLLRIIIRGSNSKFQLTIGVFSIVFAMSVIESWGIPENTDDAIRTAISMVNKRSCNDFICASSTLLIILLSEYYYVPIRKINLCC